MKSEIQNTLIVFPQYWEEKTTDYFVQTARILAKKNQVVVYHLEKNHDPKHLIKRIRIKGELPILYRDRDNILHFVPINLFPLLRFRLVRKLNLFIDMVFIFLAVGKKTRFLWIFDPESVGLQPAFKLFSRVIFDCVDHFGSTSTPKSRQVQRNALKLAQSASYVFANSHTLFNFYKKTHQIPHTYLVPQGFRVDSFEGFSFHDKREGVLANQKTVVGFIGGISRRLDLDLLLQLAEKRKDVTFVLVGPVVSFGEHKQFLEKLQRLKKFPNVKLKKSITDKTKIPQVINQFDICMIPYDISLDFNRYCYPMKLFEYFFIGKPVISTPIEELKRKEFKDLVEIGSTAEEWAAHIRKLTAKPWPQKYQQEQRQLARDNSWENKVAAISKVVTSPRP